MKQLCRRGSETNLPLGWGVQQAKGLPKCSATLVAFLTGDLSGPFASANPSNFETANEASLQAIQANIFENEIPNHSASIGMTASL